MSKASAALAMSTARSMPKRHEALVVLVEAVVDMRRRQAARILDRLRQRHPVAGLGQVVADDQDAEAAGEMIPEPAMMPRTPGRAIAAVRPHRLVAGAVDADDVQRKPVDETARRIGLREFLANVRAADDPLWLSSGSSTHASTIDRVWCMRLRPTWSLELARPFGWRPLAERRRSRAVPMPLPQRTTRSASCRCRTPVIRSI